MTTDAETTLSEMAEETRENRTLNELLALDSYASMNDEEIETVIAYKNEQAIYYADIEAQKEVYEKESAARIEAMRDSASQYQQYYVNLLDTIEANFAPLRTSFINEGTTLVTPTRIVWSNNE